MNIVEAHTLVRSLIDQVKSPRVTRTLIDEFLNVGNRKYYNLFAEQFQQTQYLRDEMKPFAVNNFPLTPTGDVFTYPANYQHETGFAVVVNGVRRKSDAMSYNEQNPINENAFTEPSATQPYHIESSVGVTSYYGAGNTLSSGFLSYLKKPLSLYWSSTNITFGPTALTVAQQYYVVSGSVLSNSVTYVAGDIFTAAVTAFTGSGVVNAVQDFEIGDACHEDLCKYAAERLDKSLSE